MIRTNKFLFLLTIYLFSITMKIYSTATIPDPIPGNPEYLVRVIYMIPKDRLLDYASYPSCPEYNEKTAKAKARIRMSLETINEYLEWQITNQFPVSDPPGIRLNFEREDNGTGDIRIIIIHGEKVTEGASGYWGDASGSAIWGLVTTEIFGSWEEITAKTQKNVYLIFPDVARWDNSLVGFRGYVSGGMSMNQSSSGWGGFALLCANVLELFPYELDPNNWDTALELVLCSRDGQMQAPNPYTGVMETWDIYLHGDSHARNTSAGFSNYFGVMIHELMHGFGVGHDGRCPMPIHQELMGSYYYLFGHSISRMKGFAGSAYPFNGIAPPESAQIASLGQMYCHMVAHCPYLSTSFHPDKTDPSVWYSYPPDGTIWPDFSSMRYRMVALEETGGSGLDAGYLFYGIDLQNYGFFPEKGILESSSLTFTDDETAMSFSGSPIQSGYNSVALEAFDFYGNRLGKSIGIFRLHRTSTIQYQAVFVGPEDYPRNLSAEEGSGMNPFLSIQEGIDTAKSRFNGGTVFLLAGTYPVLSTIYLKTNVHLVGENVGRVILDGKGNASLNILEFNEITTSLTSNYISQITFAKAGRGITKTVTDRTCNILILNCLFYNLSLEAVSLTNLNYDIKITQNSVIDCGSGFILNNYPDDWCPDCVLDDPKYCFEIKNNLVYNRTGNGYRGIRLENISRLGEKGRSGWNNSFGYSYNFSGQSNYSDSRLPGEMSIPTQFILESVYDFRLVPGARCTREGDTFSSNMDGSRRDIGAFIDTPSLTKVRTWMNYE